jgi:hypothetical protein
LPKSRLSTATIKRLSQAHVGLGLIAELAAMTPNGVRYRLHPDRQRRPYRFGSAHARHRYMAKQRQRQQDYQRRSLAHAENFGQWTAAEMRFVEKNAPELTLLELAVHLKRTYYAVSHYVNRHGIETHN